MTTINCCGTSCRPAPPSRAPSTRKRDSMRSLLSVAVVLGLVQPVVACGPPANTRELDSVIQQALAIWNVPGVAVAVVRGDEVVYLKGHGARDVGNKAPV